ncbi:hypothetical protein OESDEN_06299 [Oesophagostomum dentatum]|uniref:Amino acid transporter transmembrane domain-containing protein n=1 Tax=Oesophagostomum dentatum TaxID=61180 RepID=A0A0B1T899_OESDE|nr:hypothetical protein OESDEN_06299 [Oesophagostomum dentatum]
MMGVSLLSMPWALYQAGLIFGIFIFIAMGALCFYTTYLILRSPRGLKKMDTTSMEFTEICRYYLGRYGEITAILLSMFVLSGAILAYYVLMSNFLYFTGNLIYELAHPSSSASTMQEEPRCDFHCQMDDSFNGEKPYNSTEPAMLFGLTFHELWKLRLSVPILLSIVTFGLLNFKSPTFFTKFNVLGTITIMYIVVFNAARLIKCGVHLSLTDTTSEVYAECKLFDL